MSLLLAYPTAIMEPATEENDAVEPVHIELGSYLWLFPIGLLLHDVEELFALPDWIATHGKILDTIASYGRTGERIAASMHAPFAHQAAAIGLVVAGAFALTWVTLRFSTRGKWFTAYLVFLGMASLHVFVHIAQAAITGGYIPGLVLAIAILLPCCIAVYRRLFKERIVTRLEAAFAAITGIALFVPTIVAVKIVTSLIPF